jgi:hypothetical protein
MLWRTAGQNIRNKLLKIGSVDPLFILLRSESQVL